MKRPLGALRDALSHRRCRGVLLDGTTDSQPRDREEDVDGTPAAPLADNVVHD